MKVKYAIIGAGIGGLAAAAELKAMGETDFMVFEQSHTVPKNLHNGVHYLHTDNFGTPFPFDLKEVKSTEEVWNPRKDEFKSTANLPEMIGYSLKVMDLRHPSSIMDPGTRAWKTYLPLDNNMNSLLCAYEEYIGKENFQFKAQVGTVNRANRTLFLPEQPAIKSVHYDHLITTAPLNRFLLCCDSPLLMDLTFQNRPLHITNYQTTRIVANWLISLYVADDQFPVYRITVLNNTISMESLAALTLEDEYIVRYHLKRYLDYDMATRQSYCWETGRIWGLTKAERAQVVRTFAEDSIYLLGRFGLWNGKLLLDNTIKQARYIVKYLTLSNNGFDFDQSGFVEALSE